MGKECTAIVLLYFLFECSGHMVGFVVTNESNFYLVWGVRLPRHHIATHRIASLAHQPTAKEVFLEMLVDHLLEAGGSGAVVPWSNVRKDLFLDKVREGPMA